MMIDDKLIRYDTCIPFECIIINNSVCVKPNYVIRNVISTCDLRQEININSFNNYTWGRYDVENNYNGQVGYVKDSNMNGRVTVFRSGKMISTGARSINSSIEQSNRTYDILLSHNFVRYTVFQTKIQNIVATHKVDDIPFSHLIRQQGVMYEPDQFPGAIYKTNHRTTVLIFSSGSLVITGAKEEIQLADSIKEIIQLAGK